ncbi:hypothetical protein BJ878DRAFT_479582 [Calycina marina]|uniref:Uncharacterized protein n=1 Tax=Calycina marina TaxID=1763456 RepID=A0A9P7Z467_9HELO|nr:hypothetical protein BJ878DRAFT_479582 [Calycina marina]
MVAGSLALLPFINYGLEQVEETMVEGLGSLQVGGAIGQVTAAAEFINPGSELVEGILEELETVRSIAEAHNPARDEDSGDEEEPEPPTPNYEALQHLHALLRYNEAQAWVEADQVLLRLLCNYERELSARHLEEIASKQIFAHSTTTDLMEYGIPLLMGIAQAERMHPYIKL